MSVETRPRRWKLSKAKEDLAGAAQVVGLALVILPLFLALIALASVLGLR